MNRVVMVLILVLFGIQYVIVDNVLTMKETLERIESNAKAACIQTASATHGSEFLESISGNAHPGKSISPSRIGNGVSPQEKPSGSYGRRDAMMNYSDDSTR